jgi:ATP-dependent helicase/nuclease subunit B
VPSQKQIETLLSPQLPLEGAMLMRGAFADAKAKAIAEFVHVQLTGAAPPGKELVYANDATAKSDEALFRLRQRILRYDDEAQPYRSREMMERLSDASDYDHLARVREWSLIGETAE